MGTLLVCLCTQKFKASQETRKELYTFFYDKGCYSLVDCVCHSIIIMANDQNVLQQLARFQRGVATKRQALQSGYEHRRNARGIRSLAQFTGRVHQSGVMTGRSGFDAFDSAARHLNPRSLANNAGRGGAAPGGQLSPQQQQQQQLQTSRDSGAGRGARSRNHGYGYPVAAAYPPFPVYQPDQPHTMPQPYAPLTAASVTDEWTPPVVRDFVDMSDYATRLAASFLSTSNWYSFVSTLIVIVVAFSQAGIIGAVLILPDAQDWYSALIAAVALFLIIIDQTFQFKTRSDRYANAAMQLASLGRNLRHYLSAVPYDERADPFDLSVGVENRINDIVNMANNRPVEVQSDIFTQNPYD